MEWVKTTAKTLPEAIDLALDNLGVDEAEAEIVVLEEPRQGLFGRMRGTARVEARVKPKAIRPKTERGRGRGRRNENGGGGKSNDRNRNRNRNRSSGRGQNDGSKSGSGRSSGGDGRNRSNDEDKAKSGGNNNPNGGRSKDRQGGKPKGNGESSAPARRRSNNGDNRDRSRNAEPKEEASMEEVSNHLRTFLSDLTEAFGFDSDVQVDDSEADVLVGSIEGQHGLLVGPKGRTLDAVQELARISCQRAVPSSIRIRVDVGGYREQRVAALESFAAKAADEAVEKGVEISLEPMSAADRKAVHNALTEDSRVETRSVGTEPRRKVLVVPVAEADVADEEPDENSDTEDNGSGEEE